VRAGYCTRASVRDREHLTNTSVRGRFGNRGADIATASRAEFKEAVDAGVIAPVDSRLGQEPPPLRACGRSRRDG